MNTFDLSSFPPADKFVSAHWAPILLSPISGSCERLVVGVAAVSASGFHLEMANALDRLHCLYGPNAPTAIAAAKLAARYLEDDLARRSTEALLRPDPAVSGITIGECRKGEGLSLHSLAQSWLSALSSLYSASRTLALVEEVMEPVVAENRAVSLPSTGDRLPFLVCDYVQSQRGGFANYFSNDLRLGGHRRVKGGSHKIMIDFSGPKLVANFGTLKAGAIANSSHYIKRRLWDLKVQRDKELGSNFVREHELLLQSPDQSDPQITDKQLYNINDALQDLEGQADLVSLRLVALPSVQEIGKRILQRAA